VEAGIVTKNVCLTDTNMKFEIYCDESGLEALTRKDAHRYMAIGGIWLPTDDK
jgi:hypothetical protein